MKKALKFGSILYLKDLIAILITAVLAIPMYKFTESHPYIFSGGTGLVYFALVYSHSWNYGRRDARKIPGYFPDMKVPLKAAAVSSVIPLIILIFRMINPDVLSLNMPVTKGEMDLFVKGCTVVGTPDLIFRLWYFYIAAFIPSGNLLAYTLTLFVQPLIMVLGYWVGLKRFSIIEFAFAKLVFSKDPNEKGKGGKKSENALRR